MGEWKEYKIGDIAEILDSRRRPLSSMERSKRKGQYPYYGASGIIDYLDGYVFESEHVLISEEGENLRSRQTPIAFLADGQFWVNNHAHIVKSDYVHNRLICYYLANMDLNPFLTGAVQPKLSQDSLNRIPLFLPESLDERKEIVSILSSLDDKIDLLHRENTTLEAMAETLFRQWFIEEANGDDISLGEVVKTTSGGTPSRKKELRELAVVLTETIRKNASIDWEIKENVRAKMRVAIKRLLRRYGYPPDMQLLATETVIKQAEMISAELIDNGTYL